MSRLNNIKLSSSGHMFKCVLHSKSTNNIYTQGLISGAWKWHNSSLFYFFNTKPFIYSEINFKELYKLI